MYFTLSVFIRDFYVRTSFDVEYADAKLLVTVNLESLNDKMQEGYKVKVDLYDREVVASAVEDSQEWWMRESIIDFRLPVKAPKQWNHETPNLYTLVLTLIKDNRETQIISHKIGFRQVDIVDGQILINGQPILLTGLTVMNTTRRQGRRYQESQ